MQDVMRSVFVMAIFGIVCSFFGCSSQPDKYRSVDVEEFSTLIADTGVVRLDVRTSEEYAEGHIAGAINIDVMGSDFEQKATAVLPMDRTIAVYCRSGRRSKSAAGILSDKGYHVVELDSGYMGWTKAGK